MSLSEITLLRHGETAWSLSGQHTGLSEILLTPRGEEEARESGRRLRDVTFDHVLSSPRIRARRTCELAGLGATAQILEDLREWTYGDYEGLLLADIRKRQPGWNIFEHGCPNGESPAQVSDRADRVLKMVRTLSGHVALVSHGHFTRALAIRWTGLAIAHGHILDSATASISILGHDKNSGGRVLKLWNRT